MDESSIVGIPELVDLALGSPEIGVVNFNILHALLHVMAKEIFSYDSQIELIQSSDGRFETILHKKVHQNSYIRPDSNMFCDILNGHTCSQIIKRDYPNIIQSNENNSDINKDSEIISEDEKITKFPQVYDKISQISQVSQAQNSELNTSECTSKFNSNNISFSSNKRKAAGKDVMVHKTTNTSQINLNSRITFNNVDKIEKLHKTKWNELRKESESNIFKNTENQEQDVKKNITILDQNINSSSSKSILSFENFLVTQSGKINLTTIPCEHTVQKAFNENSQGCDRERGGMDRQSFENRIKEMEITISRLKKQLTVAEKEMDKYHKAIALNQKLITELQNSPLVTSELKNEQFSYIINEVERLQKDMKQLRKEVNYLVGNKIDINPMRQECQKTKKKDQSLTNISNADSQFDFFWQKFGLFDEKFSLVDSHIFNMEKGICELKLKYKDLSENKKHSNSLSLPALANTANSEGDGKNFKEFIESLENQIKTLTKDMDAFKLLAETNRQSIESLITSKLDKVEIGELLSEKADYRMLERKLSKDVYDTNNDQLQNRLKLIYDRLERQEQRIQDKYEIIMALLDKKLDDDTFKPIHMTLDNKIQLLTKKIDICCTNKDDNPEGSVTRYLRNVNCIACDQSCIMKTIELPSCTNTNKAHAIKSIKPSLLYNLDNLKKETNIASQSRNLKHFEVLTKLGDHLQRETDKFTLRYCGGSHTKINNQNRREKGIGRSEKTKLVVDDDVCTCK